MENELNYLSEKIDKVQARLERQKNNKRMLDKIQYQNVIKGTEKELELLDSIMTYITLGVMAK